MADPMTAEMAAPEMPGEGTSSTEIARRTSGGQEIAALPLMNDEEIRRTWRLASALAQSGMFKDARQAEQAFAKILLGRDLGLSPTQSMTGIHIVEGKPEVAAVTLAHFIRRIDGLDYKVVKHTNDECSIEFYAHGELRGTSTFTKEDAVTAELDKPRGSAKSNHVKYPRNMFFARAMSNGCKWLLPEVLAGIPVYTEGEIQAEVDARHAIEHEVASATLPEHLNALVQRASVIDTTAWSVREVAARLPLPGDEGFDEAVSAIAAEVTAWLDEHDPSDAVVVPEPAGEGEEVSGSVETVDVAAELNRKWLEEPEWRAQVEPLLSRYVDVETALDQAVGEDAPNQEELRASLSAVTNDLDALGVPGGWWPATTSDAS